jgi:integrase/recombinase XerD
MLKATRGIRKVALWLGHADIRTTEVYLRVDPSEKLEGSRRLCHLACVVGDSKHPTR